VDDELTWDFDDVAVNRRHPMSDVRVP